MTTLVLKAPLAGWCLPLAEVPDPVFADRMAGDGVAIDPTGNVVHAPCDGTIVPMKGAKHALTVRTALGHDILLHVGIDTVNLNGEGFELLVSPGQAVKAGQPLLRFDLDLIARRAKSAVTPVLLASEGIIRSASRDCPLEVGDFLMEIETGAAAAPHASPTAPTREIVQRFNVPFEHGLHARPAAQVAAALRPFAAEVLVVSHGRSANARSTTALMALGVRCGEAIEVRASGAQAAEAVVALEVLLAPVARAAPAAPRVAAPGARRIEGVVACRGMVVGVAVQWTQPEMPVAEAGGASAQESQALQAAIAAVGAHLSELARTAAGEQRAILGAHLELIQDPDLTDQAEAWLKRGKSAGYAWRQATRSTIDALCALEDERMRERAADLRDLENQVLRVLAGEAPGAARALPDNAIVLADELLPSQLASLDRQRLAGICMARGGPTSHVAIIAASMGIPALVAAGNGVLDVAEGTVLVLDAERGHLDVDPAPAERAAIEGLLAARATQRAADLAAARDPARTTDGTAIAVYANLGALAETAGAVMHGAEGCGLLRTEFLFLDRREAPGEDEQAREYQAIAAALAGRPLTIRTLDIGGDKPIAYLPLPREENPALGLRGLRTSLWQPQLLKSQLRAILRVQPAGQCRILLPMVTDVADLRTVRAMLDVCRAELGLAGAPALGVMIETPASALLADQLAREADFFSIGTNDLSQYALAMDRGHPELAAKLDALHPAVLRLIAGAVEAAHAADKEVAVCGGLASDLAAIPILIGLGIREISAVPAAIPRIKRTIRSLDLAACSELAQRALEQLTAQAVRQLME